MNQSERVEVFKGILSKSVHPEAVAGAYAAYKKVMTQIETAEPGQPVVRHELCRKCLIGQHDECANGSVAYLGFPNRRFKSVQQVTINCLCERCNPADHPHGDGGGGATLSDG